MPSPPIPTPTNPYVAPEPGSIENLLCHVAQGDSAGRGSIFQSFLGAVKFKLRLK